jgi:hypothetical protein
MLQSTNKIRRIVDMLIPHSNKSNLPHKHAAVIMCGGKPIIYGYNHDRMSNRNKVSVSFHAEMDVLNRYASLNNSQNARLLMNDSIRSLSIQRKHILKGAQVTWV